MLVEMLADRDPGSAGTRQKPLICSHFSEADARIRTGDPFITSEVLYQLSYVGVGGTGV